ncbi:hypothetical protein [Vogesella sp. LIG4]|uniref:hypothetical protein n=1 Tax=Vogesella sp. LIG4 TaxID=1192162 RepID=UPI00081FE94A|nr:hypothetical protein [Vogesella sp. LIG4]SCK04973.1 hypothetical protein PSELUDRAFT_0043 [Vogesella sp. LIG4]
MTTRLFPLLAALLLAGCAHYQWRHPDGAENFDTDSYQCKQEAAKAFPPEVRNVTVYPGHFIGPYWHCPPGAFNRGACWYSPGFWDWPEVQAYDINEKSRVDLYNSCLKARGWAYIRVD